MESAYALATFLFFETSFTVGTNFLLSPVFSPVTRNPTIFPVFLSATRRSLTNFLFSFFHFIALLVLGPEEQEGV
ncbi:MAG: hypothetical protein OK474_12220 [Thaumarchaeota archaeon]|nr:hypothetical protein [Nitrososphaerota archaeon]